MDIAVYNISGQETGKKVTLESSVFEVEPNDHAIYLDVKQYLANQRQGTHKSKERGEVKASTKKIKRQKGTGTARAGSISSPLFKGGGRVFGPRPRDYSFKLNKKIKTLARKSALSYKVKDGGLIVLEDFSFEAPKTKSMLDLIKSLKLDTNKSLFVVPEMNKNIFLSSRNLQKTNVIVAADLNTYQVLNADKLILCEGSIEKIENILK